MPTWSEHSREWSLYCSYDSRLPCETEPATQQDELYDSDTLSTDVQHSDMSSSRESFPTSDSLYAPPSPRTLRCVAQNRPNSQYTSLRDVPPLSFDSASNSAAHRGAPTSTKVAPTSLPPLPPNPSYSRSQNSGALTHPPSDSIPSGSLRVVNRDPQPLIISSSAPIDGNSRVRLKEKPIREKIGFTDPFTNQNLNQPSVGLQTQLDEKQALNTELDDVTQQLKDAFKSSSEARSLDEGRQPSSQPLSVRGQPESTQYRSVFENPPPGKVLAGENRLPNCYTCMYDANARHLHNIVEEDYHKKVLESEAEELLLLQRKEREYRRLRVEEERSRRQTQSTWWWPGSTTSGSVIARSPTTTWIENVRDVRPGRKPAPPKIEVMTVPADAVPTKPSARVTEKPAPPKLDSKSEKKAAPETPTLTASKAETTRSSSPPVDLVSSSPSNVTGPDAPAKADPPIKAPSTTPSPASATKVVQYAERIKLRLAAKKTSAANEALRDAQWDTIDLSDDEEWDKVTADEGAEWEVLEG